ncbi:hypothetical protein LBMAG42_30260 [Deltaproteobacteria bacterium]|nr:hypothetical protein LBMAG42_30260 [Deltaproteobacteria bacterium]
MLAAHGLGLGPWVFSPWVQLFAEAGVELRPLSLPGHDGGSVEASFDDVVRCLDEAVAAVEGPVILLGHSFSGLAAQVVATRRSLHAAVFVCPLPPGPMHLPMRPSLLRHVPRALATLALGRPFMPSRSAWKELGFSNLRGNALEDALARVVPWPNRLCRDLVRPPWILPTHVDTPVLVTLGGSDPILDPSEARVVGDLFEGLVWRYDGLGHTPMLEEGGERMGRDIVSFCLAPSRPRVLESEGFGPAEGAGHALRRARRGERAKRRSAYGQKKGTA